MGEMFYKAIKVRMLGDDKAINIDMIYIGQWYCFGYAIILLQIRV